MEPPIMSLATVKELLSEFHSISTNNIRKREIETQLVDFQYNPNSWSHCIYYLSNESNQYLWFFYISTIENTIIRRWESVCPFDRNRIRDTLWSNYANLTGDDVPKVKREKLAQLIGLIAKRDFPDENPQYISHVMNLLKTNLNLGITLIRATSDELVSTKEDVSTDRKKHFTATMIHCVPEIFEGIYHFLMLSGYRLSDSTDSFNSIDVCNLLHAMPNSGPGFIAAVTDLITCVQHLFTWIPLDNVVNDNLLMILFEFAKWKENADDISIAALSSISELFYRQVSLPRPLTIANGIKCILEQNELNKSSDLYQEKLTELLKLFTTQHWKLWLDSDDAYDVIMLLYQFTFSGNGAAAFTERLIIWCPIIQRLATVGFGRNAEIVHLLISGILRKMQFRFDQGAELDILDNESLDDNMETEWQHYLTRCIETIVLTAEGRPLEIFEQVYNDWQRPFEMFMLLEKSCDAFSLNINDHNKCHLIHCVTRDLSSLCQTLTNLVPILQSSLSELPQNLHQLGYNLVQAVGFFSKSKLYSLHTHLPQLTTDFVDFYAQILSALRCFLGWSLALQDEQQLKGLIENVSYTLALKLSVHSPSSTSMPSATIGQESKIIIFAAAQLLLSITSGVRPKYALECISLGQLIQAGNNLHLMDRTASICVQKSIVNCFVLPWHNVSASEQDYERRKLLLQQYIGCIAQDLLRLDHTVGGNGQENKIVKIAITILPILREILDYYNDQSSVVKHMLLLAFKPAINKSISLFNSFGTDCMDIATNVLNFIFSVLRTLQMQLGMAYIKEVLEIFLTASTREQLTSARLKSIDKLLQMLLLVVEQPGGASLSLLPATLNLALEFVVPLLLQETSSHDLGDVSISLFSLFDGILHHKWQYFYKSHVMRGFSPGASDTAIPNYDDDDDGPEHADQLLAILTAYGQALVNSNDPHIIRILLTSLQSLNERWKLFNRDFFKKNLLASFHCALINALLLPEGALHNDYLLSVLFTMGQVNTEMLHESFVNIGFANDAKNVKHICGAKDLPTFSQHMAHLIQDTRCQQFFQL